MNFSTFKQTKNQILLLLSRCFFVLFTSTVGVWSAHANNVTRPAMQISKYKVSSGQLNTVSQFQSQFIAARDIHIWLPENYDTMVNSNKKFSVLYMHDGQMLFDAEQTWNKQEWGVDEVASQLIALEKIKSFIVVGIDNGGKKLRHAEYFPEQPFEALSKEQQATLYKKELAPNELLFGGFKVQSDAYLKFLVEELKPFIDANFSVLSNKENTFIMGSSMGGLISLYAISEYPEVFGGAACLSTHWPGAFEFENNPIPTTFFNYMRENLPSATDHKIYFDHGTKTLDAFYPDLQKQVDVIMKQKGYVPSSWRTQVFKNAAHDEISWKKRLHIPITFLLSNESKAKQSH